MILEDYEINKYWDLLKKSVDFIIDRVVLFPVNNGLSVVVAVVSVTRMLYLFERNSPKH